MNAKLLIALLSTSLLTLAGTAAAVGGDVAGLVYADASATGRADYSGAYEFAHETEDELEETVRSTLDSATQTAMSQKANADAKLTYEIQQGSSASGSAKGGLLAGISENLEAFGAWAKSLYVKPSADVKHAIDADGVIGVVDDAAANDGSLDVGAAENLEGIGHVDYNLPPPPAPKMGFVQSMKIAFEALFEL